MLQFCQYIPNLSLLSICVLFITPPHISFASERPFSQLPERTLSTEEAPSKTILLIGESLSSDYTVPKHQAWITQLESKIKTELPRWQFINMSMPSYTVRNAKRHIQHYIKDHQPNVVLIQLGNTDALRASAVRDIQSDMEELISHIRAHNIELMILGSSLNESLGENYAKRFVEMHEKLALSEQAGLVPDLLAGVSSEPSKLEKDGINANIAGHQAILNNAWSPIKTFIDCIEAEGECAFVPSETENPSTPSTITKR